MGFNSAFKGLRLHREKIIWAAYENLKKNVAKDSAG
jgi:hypothetical protein